MISARSRSALSAGLISNDGYIPDIRLFKSILQGSISIHDLFPMPIGTCKIEALQGFGYGTKLSGDPLYWYFNKLYVDMINVILYKLSMRDESFFLRPVHEWRPLHNYFRCSPAFRFPWLKLT